MVTGRWCRREWSSPADARNADATRRLYSSVFLGSPGKFYQINPINFVAYILENIQGPINKKNVTAQHLFNMQLLTLHIISVYVC